MAEIYFTITGTNHHHGQDFLEPKMKVKLVKEPDNEYDKESRGTGKVDFSLSPWSFFGYYSSAKLFSSDPFLLYSLKLSIFP